jgi:hypothetical protein
MASQICSNCQAENPEGARYCNRCGSRIGSAFIDADLEQRLLERIEAKLKDDFLSKEVVEKEIALNAATQFSEWAKLFAIALAVPATILGVVFAFFGITSTRDLRDLRKTAADLQLQYKPLQDELPKLTEIANSVRGLDDRVQHVENEVARFAPSSNLSGSTKQQLSEVLKQYVKFLSGIGLQTKSVPTIHVQDVLPEPGYDSYLRGDDMYVQSDHAFPANVLHEYSHAVLMGPISGDYDKQWEYSAIEAGIACYLTADFLTRNGQLKSPIVGNRDLRQRLPISNIRHTFQGGQDEGAGAWGSFLWALQKQFGSDKTNLATARAWGAVRPTSQPGDYQKIFVDALISEGLDASAVKKLLRP